MFEPALLVTYTLACLAFSLVPGPSVTVVVANSLSGGLRGGALTILGTEISMLSMVIVVALGLQIVVEIVGGAFFWIKLAGAAYLIWIGWQMFMEKGRLKLESGQAVKPARDYIVQGAMVNWGNPKTLIFLSAFLPQFVRLDQPAFAQIMVLGAIVMAVATITDFGYAVLAGSLRNVLTQARVRIVSRVSGVILMCGGVWLALQRRS